MARVRGLIGDKLAGVYSGIQKDAPLDNVLAAVQAAREQRADLLIAVGAGSVLKAVRIIAILLAETQPLEQSWWSTLRVDDLEQRSAK